MNLQSINTDTSGISFQKLKIQQGSFKALKKSKYFPTPKNCPKYNETLLNFYIKLLQLKKRADKNELYNVIIKPEKSLTGNSGKVVIENAEGREQAGFVTQFDELLRIREFEPQKALTKEEVPNPLARWYKNKKIERNNKKIINDRLDFKKFLSIIYKRLEGIVHNAECLEDLRRLHEECNRKEL